jgi:hypothetical protein
MLREETSSFTSGRLRADAGSMKNYQMSGIGSLSKRWLTTARTHVSRTREAIAAHLAPSKRPALPVRAKQFTVSWQNGFESGGQVQRKLRLTLNSTAPQPAN